MANGYPIPSWLRPTDVTTPYITGYKAGASVAEQNAQLQAQAAMQSQKLQAQMQQAAMEAQQAEQANQIKQQQIQADALLQQTRATQEAEYHKQTTSLRAAQLGVQKQRLDQAANESAAHTAAVKGYQDELDAEMAKPEKDRNVGRVILKWIPLTSKGGTVPSAAISGMGDQGVSTETITDPSTGQPMPGAYLVRGAGARPQVRNVPPERTTLEQRTEVSRTTGEIRQGQRDLREFLKDYSWAIGSKQDPTSKAYQEYAEALEQAQETAREILKTQPNDPLARRVLSLRNLRASSGQQTGGGAGKDDTISVGGYQLRRVR